MMGSSIVRGLVAGAALLSLAAVTGAIGVFDVSDLAAGGTIVTLLLLLALVLFDDSWEPADAPGDAAPHADPLTPDGRLVAERVVDAGSTAA
jgi:hypothetical protein